MTTEMSPSSRNLSWTQPFGGLPLDNGLYKATADQKFHYGSRIMTFDGRVFKYCGSKGAGLSGFGSWNGAPAANLIGAVLPAAVAVGTKRTIAVTVAAGDGYAGDGVVAKDELVGGYVVMGHGESKVQNRLIIGNTAVASGGGTTYIDVDGAIELAMTASSSYCEVVLNPYAYTIGGQTTGNDTAAWMCVPATNVTSTYSYWGQTAGPCWVTPGGTTSTSLGKADGDRLLYWVGDGSVNDTTELSGSTTGRQIAGYMIDTTSAAVAGMPLVMLQLSY